MNKQTIGYVTQRKDYSTHKDDFSPNSGLFMIDNGGKLKTEYRSTSVQQQEEYL